MLLLEVLAGRNLTIYACFSIAANPSKDDNDDDDDDSCLPYT